MIPSPHAHDLRVAWMRLAATLDAQEELARDVFSELEARYSEPQRAYHNLEHVRQVLHTVERLAAYVENLAQVQAAAWLHDVVYDPRASDNEARSAAYAGARLTVLGQTSGFSAAVRRLILLTRDHQTTSDDADGCVLLDADLAILGAPPAEYALYSAAIRHEYDWVAEDAYREGRVALLRRFLQRPFIYHTAPMREEREQVARENLRAEIKRLSR